MKKVFLMFLAVAATVLSTGCSYDDSELKGRVDTLETKVAALEEAVAKINTNITSMQALIDALEGKKFITDIQPLADGTGYEITIENGDPITIFHGTDGVNGEDGTDGKDGNSINPKLSPDDGCYYWAVGDEFILYNGIKIPVTAEAPTPAIKIEGAEFFFSVDGSDAKWVKIGDTSTMGVGMIQNVEEQSDKVVFTLANGNTIEISKVQTFALNINVNEVGMKAGGSVDVPYTITAADDATMVKVISENGYVVTVNTAESKLTITAPTPLVDASILVIAVNGSGVMSGKMLLLAEGAINVVADATPVPLEGGNVEITVNTNLFYDVVIPVADQSWIQLVPPTKALRADKLTFKVSENDTPVARNSTININDKEGVLLKTFVIAQAKGYDWNKADLATIYPGGDITKSQDVAWFDMASTAGWQVVQGRYYNITPSIFNKGYVPEAAIMLSGVPSAAGSITSPSLSGGCTKVKVDYGIHMAVTAGVYGNGLSVNVKVLDSTNAVVLNKNMVLEFTTVVEFKNAYWKKLQTQTFDVNVSGAFKIVVSNNCPKNNPDAGTGFDICDIFGISYVPQE